MHDETLEIDDPAAITISDYSRHTANRERSVHIIINHTEFLSDEIRSPEHNRMLILKARAPFPNRPLCTLRFSLHRSYLHPVRSFNATPIFNKMDAVTITNDPSLPTSAAQDAGKIDHQKSGNKIQVASHNQYTTPRLLSSEVDPNPMIQFQKWLSSALHPQEGQPEVHEPEAMTICTSSPTGVPSARVVLLKQADDTGFVFYTNYNSRKSRELASNPYASIAIYWRELSRSVRVVGKAEKVSREESVEYFDSRPRGSQIGAWASRQSEVLEDEHVLEDRVKAIEKKFEGRKVECPEFWGGWRIVPL
jgi:pyridoxamine 5'-phosphate oxidase